MANLQGIDMEMMSNMFRQMESCCGEEKMDMEHERMMMDMMPRCMRMMIPNMSMGMRADFMVKMVGMMMDKATEGMTPEQRYQMIARIEDRIRY